MRAAYTLLPTVVITVAFVFACRIGARQRVARSVAKGTYLFNVTGNGGRPVITHTANATLLSK